MNEQPTTISNTDQATNGDRHDGGPRIFSRIADIMQEISAIGKNNRNDQQNYKFRSIYDVYNKVQPLLAKHRVFSTTEVLDRQREERQTSRGGTLIYTILTIRYRFYTDDGSYVDITVDGEGMDSGDKSSNKAMSAGHKYALVQLFAIPESDIAEADATSPPPSRPAGRPDSQSRKPSGELSRGQINHIKGKISKLPDTHVLQKVKPARLSTAQYERLKKYCALFNDTIASLTELYDNGTILKGTYRAQLAAAERTTKPQELAGLIEDLDFSSEPPPDPADNGPSMNEPADADQIATITAGLKYLPEERRQIIRDAIDAGLVFGAADEILMEIYDAKGDSYD